MRNEIIIGIVGAALTYETVFGEDRKPHTHTHYPIESAYQNDNVIAVSGTTTTTTQPPIVSGFQWDGSDWVAE